MKPKIVLENEVYRKVMHWVNKSQHEVSGLGTLKIEPNGVLRVVSVMLLPQENGATHTDIEPEHVNKALYELRNAEGELKWWWHSHVNMAVFWSGTDWDTIKKLGEAGWFACTVFNKKNETKSCYYSGHGQITPWGPQPLCLDDLDLSIDTPTMTIPAEWDEEYERNVKIKSYPSSTGMYGRDWLHNTGWRKDESGAWVRVPGETTGTTTDMASRYNFNPAIKPPEDRPAGLSKRTYKMWKKAHREWEEDQHEERGNKILSIGENSHVPKIVDAREVDDYGFTQEERSLFSKEGWSEHDIDFLLDADFTPSEMLVLAQSGVKIMDVRVLVAQGYEAGEIFELMDGPTDDDIPVADRGQGSGGINDFQQ